MAALGRGRADAHLGPRRAGRPRAGLGADRGRAARAPASAARCSAGWPQDPTEGPCTGDWCVLRRVAGPPADRSSGCCPRRTAVVRAAAGEQSHGQVLCANVDLAAVVVALHPLPVLAKVERLVALAWESGARPLVVLTKADLVGDADAGRRGRRRRRARRRGGGGQRA